VPVYILFDTETTGNAEKDRIIQIGGIVLHNREKVEVYDELCSSDIPISFEAMEVHNITPDRIEDKPPVTQTEFYSKIVEHNDTANYLIAHNIHFDLGMLKKEGFENRYTLIDTVRCARHLYDDLPYHRLQYLRYALGLYKEEEKEAQSLGITIKAHDAIGDVLIMKLLLSRLVAEARQKFPDTDVMGKLAELTQTPVLVKTFKFGKYKGKEIEEVAHDDAGYLKWMRANLDLDEDMTYTLDHYLKG
jgi:DNA polymerase III epsilon subunit-like protein